MITINGVEVHLCSRKRFELGYITCCQCGGEMWLQKHKVETRYCLHCGRKLWVIMEDTVKHLFKKAA